MPELADALAEVLGASSITELQQLSGGASRETFRFRADGAAFVLQRQRGGYSRDIGHEARVVQEAGAAGVPVAKVVAWSAQPSVIGSAYMVLTAVEGETIARKILRDDRFATARLMLPAQLGAALAALHAIDPATVPFLTAADQLAEYRSALDQTGRAHPAFELAFRWLAAHAPEPRTPVLVHGDYRLGNVIVGEQGLHAVIDWELAHLGDPMEDLGWLCVKAWRFGSALPVAGVGHYEQLFQAYEGAGGSAVDPTAVRWWEVFGTLKWGIICITQGMAHTSGQARSHELAAIGRRVCENEHDLFLALEGSW